MASGLGRMSLRRTIDAIQLRRKPRCERCHARGAVRRVDVGGVSWVLCARCEQETSVSVLGIARADRDRMSVGLPPDGSA